MSGRTKKQKEADEEQSLKTPTTSWFSRIGIGEEKDYFIENLAMLLSSGMDILSALKAIRGELHSRTMLRIIDGLIEDIDSGSPIWKALHRVYFLPEYVISLVRIGEESGRLSENLRVVALEQEKSRGFRSKIRSAMAYPVLVFSVTVIVGLGIAWFILPRLLLVFSQLHVELPLITKILLAIGRFVTLYGFIAIPGIIIGLFVFSFFFFVFKASKWLGQALLFYIPPVRKLIREIELARMGFMMGTLLEAGLPIVQSLASLEEASTFYKFKEYYAVLKDRIEEGDTFQKSFLSNRKNRHLIPLPVQEMIITGEKSGHLPEMFKKIGQVFENKTEVTTKNVVILLEPILLVAVWLGVVFVALAIILPIYRLIGGLNK